MGEASFYRGEFSQAREHLKKRSGATTRRNTEPPEYIFLSGGPRAVWALIAI